MYTFSFRTASPDRKKKRTERERDKCLEELIKCMGSGGNARACAAVLTMRCTETTFYSWLPQRTALPEWAEMRPCCTELPWKLQGTGEKVQDSGCALKFCQFITYSRMPSACKLWRGPQKHSLLTWKNHFTGYYEELFLLHWMNLICETPRLWLFITLFRGNKMLKRDRADMSHTISKAANKQVHHCGWYFHTGIIMQITSTKKKAKTDMMVISKCSHGSIYWAEMDRDGQYTADSPALQIFIMFLLIFSVY